MGKLDFLAKTPSKKATKWLMIGSLVLVLIMYPVMGFFFFASGDQANVFASQLCFSGEFLTNQYTYMVNNGDIDAYQIAQTLDFLFMVGYGLLTFSLALVIGRKFDETSSWHQSSYIVALAGVSSAFFDAMENSFILATLKTPTNVPDSLAIAHSTFALIKWILLISAIVWAIIAVVSLKLKKK